MSKYKFELLKSTSNDAGILFYFSHSNKRFKYGTGKKINIELWDKETQRPVVKIPKDFLVNNPGLKIELENIRTRLDNLVTETNRYITTKELSKEPVNFDELKTYLKEVFNQIKVQPKQKENTVPLIRDLIENFINDIEQGKKTINGRLYTKATITMYQAFAANYNEFESIEGCNYLITDIGKHFVNSLHEYFNDVKEYQPKTKGKFIKRLKAIINDFINTQSSIIYQAEKNGIETELKSVDLFYVEKELKKIHCPDSESVKIALTDTELERIFNLDLTNKPHLDKARDIFLCGCYTALRFSDYGRLAPEHIKGKTLDIITQKTKKKVSIPIRPELMQILKKYEYKVPAMPPQKVGKYIKEIGEMAGIDEHIEVKESTGGKEKTVIKFKYELITTHTARRTAASLMYFHGIPAKDIMTITGHSKLETFEKYIITNNTERDNRIMQSQFFRGNLKVV